MPQLEHISLRVTSERKLAPARLAAAAAASRFRRWHARHVPRRRY
jgi:hypothetical protein